LIKISEPIAVILLVSIVYPLGVFIDEIADSISKNYGHKIKIKYVQNEFSSVRKLITAMKDQTFANYMDYVRIRIVRQEVASQIAAMPLLPLGVTLLWHAFSVMKRCEAHETMWRNLKV
jgi:hypothetical protein